MSTEEKHESASAPNSPSLAPANLSASLTPVSSTQPAVGGFQFGTQRGTQPSTQSDTQAPNADASVHPVHGFSQDVPSTRLPQPSVTRTNPPRQVPRSIQSPRPAHYLTTRTHEESTHAEPETLACGHPAHPIHPQHFGDEPGHPVIKQIMLNPVAPFYPTPMITPPGKGKKAPAGGSTAPTAPANEPNATQAAEASQTTRTAQAVPDAKPNTARDTAEGRPAGAARVRRTNTVTLPAPQPPQTINIYLGFTCPLEADRATMITPEVRRKAPPKNTFDLVNVFQFLCKILFLVVFAVAVLVAHEAKTKGKFGL